LAAEQHCVCGFPGVGWSRSPLATMRDLAQILAHVPDAEIEIGEGPEPPCDVVRKQLQIVNCP
jgi:hypothetical protein